jgi:hypothetical protein
MILALAVLVARLALNLNGAPDSPRGAPVLASIIHR